jgi:hypothetical protein
MGLFAVCLLNVPILVAAKKALDTPVNGPAQLVFDSAGDLYVSEYFGHRILRLDSTTGTITVVAGNGRECCHREDRDADHVSVYNLQSLTVDQSGNLYFGGRNAKDGAFVRKISTQSNRIMTIAGGTSAGLPATVTERAALEVNMSDPKGLIVTASGAILVSTEESDQIVQIDDTAKTFVGGSLAPDLLKSPGSLAKDKEGDIFVADYLHHCIKKIDAHSHSVTTVAGDGAAKESGDGGKAIDAGIPYPVSIAISSTGDIYVVGNGTYKIRRIDEATGIISTVAGTGEAGFSRDGVRASTAKIEPFAIALDGKDNLYFSELDSNRVRRIDQNTGVLATVAGNGLPKRKVKIE